jgi:dihydroorotase
VCEFEYAKYGMSGLETCFAAVHTALPQLPASKLAELFAIAPAIIFGLELPPIQAGAPAMLSLVQLQQAWQPQLSDLKSASQNNAFIGRRLQAKAVGMVNGHHQIIHL